MSAQAVTGVFTVSLAGAWADAWEKRAHNPTINAPIRRRVTSPLTIRPLFGNEVLINSRYGPESHIICKWITFLAEWLGACRIRIMCLHRPLCQSNKVQPFSSLSSRTKFTSSNRMALPRS